MKYLLLWFEAPLQAWGSDSKFDMRMTRDFPTKSGIYGILLSAAGEIGEQNEKLALIADALVVGYGLKKSPGLNSHEEPFVPLLRDFHMVGNGYNEKDNWEKLCIPTSPNAKNKSAKLTYRHYLQDRTLAAIVGFPDELASFYFEALQNPRYPIYLGRKCCVPTDIVIRGDAPFATFEDAEIALKNLAKEKNLALAYEVRDAPIGSEHSMEIYDIPVQFGLHKIYRDRTVVKKVYKE